MTRVSDSIVAIDHDAYGNVYIDFDVDPTITGSHTAFLNGGNQAVAPLVLGSKNSHPLEIRTNNLNRIYIQNAGNVGIHTNSPNSGLEVNTSMGYAIKTVGSNYTLTNSDKVLIVTAVSTISLPSAAGIKGRVYTIKNAGSGIVTVNSGGGTIDGVASQTITANKYIEVISDGSNWFIIGAN